MKKHLLTGVLAIALVSVVGFDPNETAPPVSKPTNNQMQKTEQHLIYLGDSKDWLAQYEVNGTSTMVGDRYSASAKGILTLTYTGNDLKPNVMLSYSFETITEHRNVTGIDMPSTGTLRTNINSENAVFLKNNPQYKLKLTVTLHGKTETMELSLKSS